MREDIKEQVEELKAIVKILMVKNHLRRTKIAEELKVKYDDLDNALRGKGRRKILAILEEIKVVFKDLLQSVNYTEAVIGVLTHTPQSVQEIKKALETKGVYMNTDELRVIIKRVSRGLAPLISKGGLYYLAQNAAEAFTFIGAARATSNDIEEWIKGLESYYKKEYARELMQSSMP